MIWLVRVSMLIFGLVALLAASVVMAAQEPDAPHDITRLWATIVDWEDGSNRYSISRIHPETGSALPLATGEGDHMEMAWTPDGEWLHFHELNASIDQQERYVHWTGWEPVRPPVDTAWFDYGAVISPDGRWVGFFDEMPDGAAPYVRPINSDDAHGPLMPTITSFTTLYRQNPTVFWSPDSEWLYVADLMLIDEDFIPTIQRVHRTGRDYQRVLVMDNIDEIDEFVPDLDWLLVMSCNPLVSWCDVYRISFDGSDVRVYSPEASIDRMWALPSGAVMVTLYGRSATSQGIWRIEADFQSMTPIAPDYTPMDVPPAWSLDKRNVALYTWHSERDQRYLLLMRANGEQARIIDAPHCHSNLFQLPPYWIDGAAYFMGFDNPICRLLRIRPGEEQPETVHVFPYDVDTIQLLPNTTDVTWIGVHTPAGSYLLRANGGQQVAAELPAAWGVQTWTQAPDMGDTDVRAAQVVGAVALVVGGLGIWWRGRRS